MLALQILRWLLLAAEVLITLPVLYLCILSLSAILTTRKSKTQGTVYLSPESSLADFAILIPAHNEEIMLGNLLTSLSALEYPKDQYSVYVVADNCTDRTTELAHAISRVQVYERFDQTRRGKGYALNWLLQQLEENGSIHDAYVILDADSVVETNFLHAMNTGLAQGARALQARYTVLNSSESPSTALRLMALTLMNHVCPLGRNGLGGSSTLTSNGMCLSRALLTQYPWQAFVIAEYYQYYLTLVQHGERVQYMPEATVRSHMLITFSSMRTQDVRWEGSELGKPTWWIALELFKAGLQLSSFVCFEAIAELLTPPLSFLVCSCLITLIISLLVWSPPGLLLSILLMGGLICYIGTAFYLLRPPRKVYTAFFRAPAFIVWKLWVFFVVRRSKKHTSEWIRTNRTSS